MWRLVLTGLLSSLAFGCAGLPPLAPRPPSQAFGTPEASPLGQTALALRARQGGRADSGFFLLDSEATAFSSRLALVEGARHSLDLQYYAVHADASTEVLLRRIREAARRGVRVRILLDDFNTAGDDAQVLRLAFEPGIEVRLFNPLAGSRASLIGRVLGSLHDIPRIAKRMHNKLFLADSAWGITGGRNLGDAYFGAGDKSNFVDLDVLATGTVVRAMAASFDRYWNDPLAYPVAQLLSPDELERLRKPLPEPPAELDAARTAQPAASAPAVAVLAAASVPGRAGAVQTAHLAPVLPDISATAVVEAHRPPLNLAALPLVWAPAALMVDAPGKIGPGDDEVDAGDTVVDGLLALMAQARSEVLIVSPYFVPGPEMMKSFADLRARGVRVRVLTNSLASNDAPAAHAGYARYRRPLLALGVELHEMRADPAAARGLAGSRGSGWAGGTGSKLPTSRASLHSKAVLIDGRLAVIGSMNLDLRSQLKNSEVALVIRSHALAQQAKAVLERTLARAAWQLADEGGALRWKAPTGAGFADATREPDASLRLRLLVRAIAPFAPDEML